MVTIASMRTSFGTGRYAGGEDDYVFTTPGPVKPPLIFCHNRGATALSCVADQGSLELFYDLAEYFTVCVSDLGGGDTWGNDTALSRITQIRTFFSSTYGLTAKPGLVAISMGGLAALNFAKANPTVSRFVCAIVPAISLQDLKTYNSTSDSNDGSTDGTYASVINTAHGGTYTDSSKGANYSPYIYRNSYPATTVKTGIWYSPDDTVCRPQFAEAFGAAQPSVEMFKVRNASGVGPSHVNSILPSVRGMSGTYYFPQPAAWCAERLKDT